MSDCFKVVIGIIIATIFFSIVSETEKEIIERSGYWRHGTNVYKLVKP